MFGSFIASIAVRGTPGRRGLAALAMLAGSATAGEACVTFTEEVRIAEADVVVDGVALCAATGTCRLTPRRIVKDPLQSYRKSRIYRVHFDPGARERLRREMDTTGTIYMCRVPWEPGSARVEGRFYLDRTRSGLRILQDSARSRVVTSEAGGPEHD